jgi:hypothetical protein
MPLSPHQNWNPEEIGRYVGTASFAQDVVLAASRFLNDQGLSARDRHALERCSEVLEMLNSDLVLQRVDDRRLEDASQTIAALRVARDEGTDGADYFQQLANAVELVLRGESTHETKALAQQLRGVFLRIGEFSLQALQEERDGEPGEPWTPLTGSSLS